jgi:hypothetical protein
MSMTEKITSASRLLAFGWRPKLTPARDDDYRMLLRQYQADPAMREALFAVAAGLGVTVLEVSERAGVVLGGDDDSVFAVRMTEYARRTGSEQRAADRVLHGMVHLGAAAMAFPRPADLADDTYVGRVSVERVDAFIREAARRLEEQATAAGEETDPPASQPMLEAAWRAYSRRNATGDTKDGRRLAASTQGMVAKALAYLADQGFLTKQSDDEDGTYRTTPRYQVQVRELAETAAYEELLALGVSAITDGTGSVYVVPSQPASGEPVAADPGGDG